MLDPFVDGRFGIGGTDRPPLGDPPDCDVCPPAPARGLFQGASDVHQGADAGAGGL